MTEKNYIDQFVLKEESTSPSGNILCYYVTSTAQPNVEEEDKKINITERTNNLTKIANYLAKENSEIVIFIHGYANKREYTEKICEKMLTYANAPNNNSEEKNNNGEKKKIVFLGYFWPSETPFTEEFNVFTSLPLLLKGLTFTPLLLFLVLFLITFVISLILPQWKILVNIFHSQNVLFYCFLIALVVTFAFIVIILTLVLLRSLTYFRDSYRATNYGVPDLVEILRQIEQSVKINGQNETKKIKLNFIGYSMGCFVATNTIRILSDVFDDRAIEGIPGKNIGKVFCLGRLVLVAPDIPLLTITSGRANFLRSSLRRCEEAYVFCNEGDLALRLASTVANYFSFPAKKLKSGYRLGNISIKSENKEYGIIKLANDNVFKQLEIRVLNAKSHLISEETDFFKCTGDENIANKFTYFDCTDYIDTQGDADYYVQDNNNSDHGIVSFAQCKSKLNLCDYIRLVFADFFKIPRRIDTHGGYFKGKFSQKLIYDLAFFGFKEMLTLKTLSGIEKSSKSCSKSDNKSLENLSQRCKIKKIKVLVSPILLKKVND